jgi:hypothetical protein
MVLALFLGGCAMDPRNEADAYAIRSQADEDAAVSKLNRSITGTDAEQRQMETAETAAQRMETRNLVSRYGGMALVVLVLGLTVATVAVYAWRVAPGLAGAAVRAAETHAGLIQLDARTRQYPLVLQRIEKGRFALINPNIGQVLHLDMSQAPDRQLIASAGQVQALGVLADAAVRAKSGDALTGMQPQLIDGACCDTVRVRVYRPRGGMDEDNNQACG